MPANAFSRSAFLNQSKPDRPAILVIEDNVIVAQDLGEVLTVGGFRVVYGYGEISADPPGFRRVIDQLVINESIALILMDIHLGADLDGIEIAGYIRRKWRLPLVYISSESIPATVLRARKTNPHGYIKKPFDARELMKRIQSALRNG